LVNSTTANDPIVASFAKELIIAVVTSNNIVA